MCFNNDYDWYAEVSSDNGAMVAEPAKCYECRRLIPPGSFARAISLMEHELCQACENGECDCPGRHDLSLDYHGCECEHPDHGETFDCWICTDCSKILLAIKEVEIAEGCHEVDSQPAIGQLWESISENEKYIEHAVERFPEVLGLLQSKGMCELETEHKEITK